MPCLNLEQRMEVLPGVDPRRIVHEMPWSVRGELVATDIARERLRRWAEAGCPEADPAEALCVGDIGVSELVTAALERIPPPVVHHVVERCLVIGAGRTNGGWAGGYTTTFAEPKILVAISGVGTDENVLAIIGHEISHAWLHASDELVPPCSALETRASQDRLTATFDELEKSDLLKPGDFLQRHRQKDQQERNRREIEACVLTQAWGFTGAAAHHRRRRR